MGDSGKTRYVKETNREFNSINSRAVPWLLQSPSTIRFIVDIVPVTTSRMEETSGQCRLLDRRSYRQIHYQQFSTMATQNVRMKQVIVAGPHVNLSDL